MGRDLHPETDAQVAFSLVVMTFGFGLYGTTLGQCVPCVLWVCLTTRCGLFGRNAAYLIGVFGTLLTNTDLTAASFRRRKEVVELFMDAHDFPVEIRRRLMGFYRVYWSSHKVHTHTPLGALPLGCLAVYALPCVLLAHSMLNHA